MFTLSLTALTVVVFRQQVVRLLAERPRLISGRSKSIEAVAGFVLVAIAIRKSCFVEGTGYHVRNVLVSALLIALAVPDEEPSILGKQIAPIARFETIAAHLARRFNHLSATSPSHCGR